MPKRRSTATIRRHRQTHVRKPCSYRQIQGGKYGRRCTRRARGGGITGTICGRRLEPSLINGSTATQCIENAKKQINEELQKEIQDLEEKQSTIEKAQLRMYECTSDTNLVKDITESPVSVSVSEKTYQITDELPITVNVKIQEQSPKTDLYFLRESNGYVVTSKLHNLKMDIQKAHKISDDEFKKYALFQEETVVSNDTGLTPTKTYTFKVPEISSAYNQTTNSVTMKNGLRTLKNGLRTLQFSPGHVFNGLPSHPNDTEESSSTLGQGYIWSSTLGVIISCTETTVTYAYERALFTSRGNRQSHPQDYKLRTPKLYVCDDIEIDNVRDKFDKIKSSGQCFYGNLKVKVKGQIGAYWSDVVWYYDPPTRSFGFGQESNTVPWYGPYSTLQNVIRALRNPVTSVTISTITDIPNQGFLSKSYSFDIVDNTNNKTHSFCAESQAQKDYCLRLFAIVKQLQSPSS